MGNGANEILAVKDDKKSIFFSALIGWSMGEPALEFDLKRLSAEGTAKYLWLRFAKGLELHWRSR